MSPSIQIPRTDSLGKKATTNATKILIVDDDLLIRRALRMTVMAAGYVAVEAATGEEALEVIQAKDDVDVVLLDLRMPGLGGLEACRHIRKISDVPILAISILREPEDKELAFDAGADDYLVKPFGIQELLSRIHALQRRTAALEPFLSF